MSRAPLCALVLVLWLGTGLAALAGDAAEESGVPEVTDTHRAAFANVRTVRLVLEEDYEKHGETFDVGLREGVVDLLGLWGLTVAGNGDADAELHLTVSARPGRRRGSPRTREWLGGDAGVEGALALRGLPLMYAGYTEAHSTPLRLGPIWAGDVADSPAWRLARQCAYSTVIDVLMRFHVQPISSVLGDRGEEHGKAVVAVLRRVGDERAIGLLVQALRHDSRRVRELAADALARKGEIAVPGLVAALGDSDFRVRLRALGPLRRIGPAAAPAVPAVIECLSDSHAVIREVAASTLPAMGPAAAPTVSALAETLSDADSDVRGAAARALGRIGPAAVSTMSALVDALSDPNWGVHREAARALGSIGSLAAPAVPALIDALSHEHSDVRREAARALGRIGPPAVPALTEALSDSLWQVRRAAGSALGDIGPAAVSATPALAGALSDPNWEVRREAARALGSIGSLAAPAVPALIGALSDERYGVRWEVARALGRIGPAAVLAVPALAEALSKGEPGDRRAAADALGLIGPQAEAAIPALEARAEDDDEDYYVRQAAREALERIRAEE
jgi:HEAT repeat protein